MTNKIKLYEENKKKDYNNSEYVKCLAEGMKDWIEVKVAVGNSDLAEIEGKIHNEISKLSKDITPKEFSIRIMGRLKELGIENDNLKEFKGVFLNKLKLSSKIA